ARLIMNELSKRIGQPIVVANKPGAGGIIGTAQALREKPDGYTLVHIATSTATKPILYKDLPYNPADIYPISIFASANYVLITNPHVPANNLQELIALIRSKPGRMN